MLRQLLRYLANNDQLVNRLAESYPIRRAAQLCVSYFYRSKAVAAKHNIDISNLKSLTPEKFKSLMRSFRNNLKEEIEAAKGKKKP